MKKYTSVFGLFAKSSLLKIVILILLSAAVQFSFFAYRINRELIHYGAGLTFANIEDLIGRASIPPLFGLTFLLASVALCLPGTSINPKTKKPPKSAVSWFNYQHIEWAFIHSPVIAS